MPHKVWTREQAKFYGDKGRARARTRCAEWHAARILAAELLRTGATKPPLDRLQELTSKLTTILLSQPSGPRSERAARVLELITRAQRNLKGMDTPSDHADKAAQPAPVLRPLDS